MIVKATRNNIYFRLMSAISDLSFFQTWCIIRSSLIVLPDLENMGNIAVGILLLLCIEVEIYVISYLLPVIGTIFDLSPIRTSGILWSTSVVLPDLEDIGIAVGISLLSCIEADTLSRIYFRLMAAIFNFSLIRTSGSLRGSLVVSPDLENMV